MTFVGLAVFLLLVCVGLGARGSAAERPWLAVCLALAMVAAQLALLMTG
jgi:hypothetical protein